MVPPPSMRLVAGRALNPSLIKRNYCLCLLRDAHRVFALLYTGLVTSGAHLIHWVYKFPAPFGRTAAVIKCMAERALLHPFGHKAKVFPQVYGAREKGEGNQYQK